MTVAEALAAGSARLASRSDSPRLDTELLLAAILDAPRGSLFARGERLLDAAQARRFEAQLERRELGEPVAYLLGSQGFWSLDLLVNAAVLVPRPETELLVEWALERIGNGACRVVDLGTGSGAIALALAHERPQAQVLATDVSPIALAVAQVNARRCGVANVEFVSGDWLSVLEGNFDLIVSNPPYIAADDAHLEALCHEPLSALSDGGDGLACLREIIADAPAHLVAGGWLLLEHGYDQAVTVRALLTEAGFVDVATRRDLGGQERCSGGRWPG